MRKYEEKFLKLVGTELTILNHIQKKMGITYEQAEDLANYLEEHHIIRTSKMMSENSRTGYIYLVAKPLKEPLPFLNKVKDLILIAGTVSAIFFGWLTYTNKKDMDSLKDENKQLKLEIEKSILTNKKARI